jgi:hypothetical protein
VGDQEQELGREAAEWGLDTPEPAPLAQGLQSLEEASGGLLICWTRWCSRGSKARGRFSPSSLPTAGFGLVL